MILINYVDSIRGRLKERSAPIGEWKCNLLALLANCDRQNDEQTRHHTYTNKHANQNCTNTTNLKNTILIILPHNKTHIERAHITITQITDTMIHRHTNTQAPHHKHSYSNTCIYDKVVIDAGV